MDNMLTPTYPLILTHMAGIENITATVEIPQGEAPIIGIVRNWEKELSPAQETRDPNDKDETDAFPRDPQEQDGLDASNY